MKKFVILLLIISMVIPTIGCVEFRSTYIIDKDGNKLEPTVDNLIYAFEKGGLVHLPSGTINVDKYVNITNVDNLEVIGYGPEYTHLYFPDHYTYEGLGTNPGQPSTVTKGLKRIFFDNCSNLKLQGFKMTGAAKVDLIVDHGYHFEDLLIENIDRPYIHNNEPGGKPQVIWMVIPKERTIAENFYFKDVRISHTTTSSIFMACEIPYQTYKNVVFEDCSLRYIGTEVNGYPLVNNWSAGFHFPETMSYRMDGIQNPNKDCFGKDFRFENCIAEYCWESGFHSEFACTQQGTVEVINCKANYNGQKDVYYDKQISYFGAGFFNFEGVATLTNCEAIGNSKHGIQITGDVHINNAICNNNGISGIHAYGWTETEKSELDIHNVVCNNNGEFGMWLRYYKDGGVVEGCTTNSNNIGLFFYRITNGNLIGNTIKNNDIGINEGDISVNNNIHDNSLCNTYNYISDSTTTIYINNEEC